MSKIKAAILTAILGTSSAAMASPTVSFNANAQFSFGTHRPAPVIRDHGQSSMPAYAMPSTRATSQVALANYLSLSTGRDVLRPESNLRASALTLRANMGMAYIQKVTVRFHDGSTQVLNLNQWMTTRKPAIELALRNNRRIDSIVIVGTPSGRASYSVFAQNERVELPRPPVYGHGGGYGDGYEQNHGMSLGTGMTFLNTDGRKFINVGTHLGSFGTLRLEGNSGRTFIQAVKVIFADGQEQFLTGLDRTLTRGESMDLKLDGRGANSIKQIIVWTDLKGDHMITPSGTFNATVL
jgi:hypothetical protein